MIINKLAKFFIRHLAKSHGFLDPINVLSHLNRFAQPSEIMAPTELMRAGAIMHARGLINALAIQHNLDWIWPYWVEEQFNPKSMAFVPRAFSATHINLTHRNWTAVGLPFAPETPIVDPRGLVMPFWNSWSVDFWIVPDQGEPLFPSRCQDVEQRYDFKDNLKVVTHVRDEGVTLDLTVQLVPCGKRVICQIDVKGCIADKAGKLVVALRPYNAEGISTLTHIEQTDGLQGFKVNHNKYVVFSEPAAKMSFSNYRKGDVYYSLNNDENQTRIHCDIEMATAAAVFAINQGSSKEITVQIPIEEKSKKEFCYKRIDPQGSWDMTLSGTTAINVPDKKMVYLFDGAVRALLIHSVDEIFPGPFTYRRFWFRDAAFIGHALLTLGLSDRVKKAIDSFSSKQLPTGYFLSQEGEWDSNGEALWLMNLYCQTTGIPPGKKWLSMIKGAAEWIERKRTSKKKPSLHQGLLPAGFSAEHFGPNDYYYWDDFFSVAGLRSAAQLCRQRKEKDALKFDNQADDFLDYILKSLEKVKTERGINAIPASPYRRMDSGAVGSLVATYPLDLFAASDSAMKETVDYLYDHCLIQGGFFHDLSHSGINPYLTLHLAQVLLRMKDPRFFSLIESMSNLASPTGQWPEAIHPNTKGGCMGDGQHIWAAAEWVLMLQHCFAYFNSRTEELTLLRGIPKQWYLSEEELSCGPIYFPCGKISLVCRCVDNELHVDIKSEWRSIPQNIVISLPGQKDVTVSSDQRQVVIPLEN